MARDGSAKVGTTTRRHAGGRPEVGPGNTNRALDGAKACVRRFFVAMNHVVRAAANVSTSDDHGQQKNPKAAGPRGSFRVLLIESRYEPLRPALRKRQKQQPQQVRSSHHRRMYRFCDRGGSAAQLLSPPAPHDSTSARSEGQAGRFAGDCETRVSAACPADGRWAARDSVAARFQRTQCVR